MYRRPASILDSDAIREIGFAVEYSEYGTDKVQIKKSNYDLNRTEESHAHILYWEKREIVVGNWEKEDA